jgi:hypothetical protein
MSKQHTRPIARVLSVILALAILALSTSLASAQPRAVSTLFTELAKLTASDAAVFNDFGRSVSISGDVLVVGASGGDPSAGYPGAAYVFERDAGGQGGWDQVAKLTASDGIADDQFGYSVSIDGETIVIGAPFTDDNGDRSGSAYLFEKPGTGWADMTETAKFTASDGAEYDDLGFSVSISGDTVVVGAPDDDDEGDHSGSAYLYEMPVGGWADMTETAKFTASDGAEMDCFGYSVSIDGDTVLVGAYGDDAGGLDSGSAYLFEKPVSGWTSMTETAKLTASAAAEQDAFGISVSIIGDAVAIGSPGDDYGGSAYLFEKPVSGWTNMTETAKLSASDGAAMDALGYAVSIGGDMLVVGAYGDSANGDQSGSAYLFEKPVSGWTSMTETAKFTASDSAWMDSFGMSVSISGDTVVVGALGNDDDGENSGSAYVFGPFTPVAWVYLPVVLRSAP